MRPRPIPTPAVSWKLRFARNVLSPIRPLSLRLSVLFLLLPLGVSDAAPAQTSARALPIEEGQLVQTHFTASALAGNLLGDPVEQPVSIYLPPGYATSPSGRYPSIYLLHGFTGHIETWTTNGYQEMNLRDVMDELIRAKAVPPMIVVVPNGWNSYLGSFYANSSSTGRWEDAIALELVAFVDQKYRTLASPKSRGVVGHSMGGYGAIVFGMHHPDVFGSVYAMSPCCLVLDEDLGADNGEWRRALELTERGQLSKDPHTALEFFLDVWVAMAAALSPDPNAPPFYAAFPYRIEDDRIVPSEPAYSLWRSKMPAYVVEQNRAQLLRLRGLAIDVGDHDDFSHIRYGSRVFSDALAERAIPHLFEIYADGDHSNRIRDRYVRSVRFFADKLEFQH